MKAQTEEFPDLAREMGLEVVNGQMLDSKLQKQGIDDKVIIANLGSFCNQCTRVQREGRIQEGFKGACAFTVYLTVWSFFTCTTYGLSPSLVID